MSNDKDTKPDKLESQAEETAIVESMRKSDEAQGRPLTPEEDEETAQAMKDYIEKFKPHQHIDTPIYKPPV